MLVTYTIFKVVLGESLELGIGVGECVSGEVRVET